MFRLFACLAVLLCLLAAPVLADDVIVRDGVTYHQEFWPNGQLKSEEPLVKGTIHGLGRYWWDNGRPYGEIPYVMGQKHGTFTLYRPDGSIDQILSYKNGAVDGINEWRNPDGSLMAKWRYQDGQAVEDLMAQNNSTGTRSDYSRDTPQAKEPYEQETVVRNDNPLMRMLMFYGLISLLAFSMVRRFGPGTSSARRMAMPDGPVTKILSAFGIRVGADAMRSMAEQAFSQLAAKAELSTWRLVPVKDGPDGAERWNIEGPDAATDGATDGGGAAGQLIWSDDDISVTMPGEAAYHFKRDTAGIAVTQGGTTVGRIAFKPGDLAIISYGDLHVTATDKMIGLLYLAEFHCGKEVYGGVMALGEGEPMQLGLKPNLPAGLTAMMVAHARFASLAEQG